MREYGSTKPIVIFGIGEIADMAHFYFTNDSHLTVEAFTVDGAFIQNQEHRQLPVVPFDHIDIDYPPSRYDMFVAIGYSQLNQLRVEKCAAAKEKGYRLTSYVSSRASIWEGFICGENCLILEDNTIQPFAQIGNNVFLWSGNHIGHHAFIADDTFIASHVVISGGVRIGRRCFMGVNASTHDHIVIGDDCVIGAGAVVSRSLAAGSVLTPPQSCSATFGSDQLSGVFARAR